MPSLIIAVNPFDLEERSVTRIPKNRRIGAMCPKSEFPVVCFYNGKPLLRAGWKRRVKHGDVVQFVAMPRGGGGGVLKSVLSLALTVAVAVWAGPALAASMGITSSV